ncbi:DUF6994 family protein [Cellulomonas bogoriensis]|uniref:Uncharacterized protein n=1 Tax=Cellulomonas bogoriensis 69B4 = DSM 16987 TaxID=1386082 RepID=A0A0A0BYW3_9CELL|nr:hypothetical protein [Cellulomonas bogoriensis]KGM12882.1 hypothetical protein N869_01025 [Cellulomonas bogoriensis 69B4 = DSM 16987]
MIDTTFDVRADAGGRDPDSYSPTLRRYHQRLWSKPLPSGALFTLTDQRRHAYLHHHSELGEFFLASDTVVPTLTNRRLGAWGGEIPEAETRAFLRVVYTIGGMMVFPGNRIGGKQTLNGARGFNGRIADRMDLTLECIRRHYLQEASPLDEVLHRYGDFFALFGDFRGYVEFFLLQDMVTANLDEVSFFIPFDDFTTPALPQDLLTYHEYRRRSIAFVEARNRRIAAWDAAH